MSVGKFFRAYAVAAGVTVAACAAEAADLPGGYGDGGAVFVPPFFWQGVYAGGFAGIAWSDVQAADNVIILTSSGVVPVSSLSSSGLMGGAQFGYNFQAGRWVYGVEAELGGLDDGASVNFSNRSLSGLLQINSTGGFYGSVAGRAGFLAWNALFYAKAGFAFFTGDVSVSAAQGGTLQDSGTFTGWTVGAGVEYPVAPNWTVKVEYQYLDFSDSNFSCCLGGYTGIYQNTITVNAVKVGFNWFVHELSSPLY